MEDRAALIQFKFERSVQTLSEAKSLAENGYWNGVVNRLYYAAFYAVSALLIQSGFKSKTHSWQKSKFNEEFLLSNRMKRETGNIYNTLFNYRSDGDYGDFITYTKDEVEPLIERTEELIYEIKKLII